MAGGASLKWPFSGIYNDLEPTFAADGSSIYFVSARPLDESDKQKDYDVERAKNERWLG